ncbi:asparagine synthase (glutamine-hydrolyzing) [Zavarzinia sp. CC-PAN008]|uniref:asparagine synthase (glutamine-hydrolyzing) n=1 Tax=Zavarzinia sp. CC-PAN008 TaxID=3243332 RepID=UPI003F747448
MCGIAGFLDGGTRAPDAVAAQAAALNAALVHRGPDGSGLWADPQGGVALGHCRLAIVDLTEAGAQPMLSRCGRYALTYNGEIYNAPELGAELAAQGVPFRGHSDTEVLLELIVRDGLEAALARASGMFAVGLWDRRERTLTLARDRLGIKPLYLAHLGDGLAFASEMSAFLGLAGRRWTLNRAAVQDLVTLAYIPAPAAILAEVEKVEAGCLVVAQGGRVVARRRWWALDAAIQEARAAPAPADEAAQLSRLEGVLEAAVKRHLIADVAVGSFLSGGIDSSLVTAYAAKARGGRIATFTIGFDDPRFDESPHAEAIARHLGTEHHTLRATADDALAIVPDLAWIHDEPFADASQIPTVLLSRLTRRHVTVALSGDGGDELFAGYARYPWGLRLDRWRRQPRLARLAVAGALRAIGPGGWDRLARLVSPALRHAGEKSAKLANTLASASPAAVYLALVSHAPDGRTLLDRQAGGPAERLAGLAQTFVDPLDQLQYVDSRLYLPDDILVKVDRATMSTGLEARVPFLDPAVLHAAWGLPRGLKLAEGRGKLALRQLLARHVPQALFERPKTGFAAPIADWLRGPLRPWADALLAREVLAADGVFDAAHVAALWAEHKAGTASRQHQLWPVLMFQHWAERWRDRLDLGGPARLAA